MDKIIDCKIIEKNIMKKLKQNCMSLSSNDIIPTLALVRVGENSDAISYEKYVVRVCGLVGVNVVHFVLDENAHMNTLKNTINEINSTSEIHGVLLFRPLPQQFDENIIKYWIDEKKDIDCMTPANLARVFESEIDGFLPCTPAAVMEIIKYYDMDLTGKHIAVIGRSMVVGKPLSMMLLSLNATVTICHSKSHNVHEIVSSADVVVAAVGKPKLINSNYIKPGAIVIDVGINVHNGKICGDVDYNDVFDIAGSITPVPGGVGSVTTAVLLKNLIKAVKRQNNIEL